MVAREELTQIANMYLSTDRLSVMPGFYSTMRERLEQLIADAEARGEERMRERAARVVEDMSRHYGPGPVIETIRALPIGANNEAPATPKRSGG